VDVVITKNKGKIMHQQVYHSSEIQAWEGRWFAQQNSAYGLMQQVAWATTEHMLPRLKQQQVKSVAVCCGQGNNAGDGYLIASYLAAQGLDYYNHNLDTSREYYSHIISTRTFDDRLNTLEYVRQAGMKVCSGGIVGLGEKKEDRTSPTFPSQHHSSQYFIVD
jgi:biotin synthase-like enzyme